MLKRKEIRGPRGRGATDPSCGPLSPAVMGSVARHGQEGEAPGSVGQGEESICTIN